MKGIPFVINFTDPSIPDKDRFVIKPQTVDSSHTSLALPGMGHIEYGEILNQDLVHLLERFAGPTPPLNPTIGQQWFNSLREAAMVWEGEKWIPVGGDKIVCTTNEYNALVRLMNNALSRPPIATPENRFPFADSVDVIPNPTFTATEYSSRYVIKQVSAQWQGATNSAFSAPLSFDVVKNGESSTLEYQGKLAATATYFWRVRFKDAQGTWSDWSTATKFTVAKGKLLAPAIYEPVSGAVDRPLDLKLSCSTLAADNGYDTLVSSDWEIWTGPLGTGNQVHVQMGATSMSYTVPPGVLSRGTTYYARVRQNGMKLGASPWSADCTFTTVQPMVVTPTIVSPEFGATVSLTPVFIGSELTIDGGVDTLVLSQWEIFGVNQNVPLMTQTVSNLRQLAVPGGILKAGTIYGVRVQYTTAKYGKSAWSTMHNFETENLTYGTVLSNYCAGTTYMAQVADGNGGTFERVEQTESAQCGWTGPQSNS